MSTTFATRSVWEPDAFAAVLGINLGTAKRAHMPAALVQFVPEGEYPPKVRAAIEGFTGDRSDDTYTLVAACLAEGLPLDHTRGVVATQPALAERLAGRNDDDVLRCWLKAVEAQQAYLREVKAAPDLMPGKVAANVASSGDSATLPPSPPSGVGMPPSKSRNVYLERADAITPEAVQWAWTDDVTGLGRIAAGTLVIAAGREGTGKSSFGIWLTAQLTLGTLPGCFYGTPRAVLFQAVEDSWAFTLVPRLIAAGADLTKVYRVGVKTTEDVELVLSLPEDNSSLEAAIREVNAAAVVIDPLMSVMAGAIDTHKEREVRQALDPLAKIAADTGVVVYGLAHFNKGNATDVASLITGSGAFKNVPRAVFGFATDKDNGCGVVTQVKNSLGRNDLPSLAYSIQEAQIPVGSGVTGVGRFVFEGESSRTVGDLLRDAQRGPRDSNSPAVSGLQEFIVSHIEEHGDSRGVVMAADVYRAAAECDEDWTEQRVKDARRRCKSPRIETRKLSFERGWVWWLEGSPGPLEDGTSTPEGGEGGKVAASPQLATLPATLPFTADQWGELDQ